MTSVRLTTAAIVLFALLAAPRTAAADCSGGSVQAIEEMARVADAIVLVDVLDHDRYMGPYADFQIELSTYRFRIRALLKGSFPETLRDVPSSPSCGMPKLERGETWLLEYFRPGTNGIPGYVWFSGWQVDRNGWAEPSVWHGLDEGRPIEDLLAAYRAHLPDTATDPGESRVWRPSELLPGALLALFAASVVLWRRRQTRTGSR
jgi:hypothetical protein